MNPETVRGQELLCDWCGCTHWRCLTKWDGECCPTCDHPPPDPKPDGPHPATMIGRR